ncbi:MAG: cyclic nucleotide-binding domain-containing protein [Rhodobacteraceae bacterium]|nr:cyclic nucleotide-binding domain-containing protein [Paracoccaceae bacterium]
MVNPSQLRNLVPLASLLPTDRAELARKAKTGTYKPGQVIFSRGESAKTVIWLLSGQVELYSEDGPKLIKADSEEAKHPLAQGARRNTTATVLKTSEVLFLDRDQLDLVLTWSQSGGMEVVELGDESAEGEVDWMTALLQGDGFQRIPPGSIGQIFAAMKPHEVEAGQPVIRQGEPGDFYYVITAGRCRVLQKSEQGSVQDRGELGPGQCFGEEALVSGDPRNATVLATTRVKLMRLAGDDFSRLLKAPILREIIVDDIPEDATLVDVRLPDEFKRGRLPGALNLPLSRLREMANDLDQAGLYVVYCDTGRRSASATYLLCERGIDARLLTGGVPVDEMPVRG